MAHRLRLRAVVLCGLVAGMLVPAAIGLQHSLRTQRVELEHKLAESLGRTTDMLALSLEEPLWNLAESTVEGLVNALERDERFVEVVVRDEQDHEWKRKESLARRLRTETISSSKDVVREGRRLGSVHLTFSKAQLEATLAQHALETTLTAFIQLLSSILVIFLILRTRVLQPVVRLVQEARLLSHHELSRKFTWDGDDELGELGQALELARGKLKESFGTIESKNSELLELNSHLEDLVAERTRSIGIILENVRSGFLMTDEEGRVLEGYTRSCTALFGREPEVGGWLYELLCVRPSLVATFQLFLHQVFEDVFPEQMSLAQIPARHRVGGNVLSLEGNAVRGPDGAVRAILFTVVDVTRLERSEKENLLNRTLVKILRQPEAFSRFLVDTRQELVHARIALGEGDGAGVRASLHTLKGNSAAFGLGEVSSFIHQVEDRKEVLSHDIDELEDRFRRFLDENRSILELSFDEEPEEVYRIRRGAMEALRQLVEDAEEGMERPLHEIRGWMAAIQRKSASSILGPLPEYAEALAQRLGKEVEVSVAGGDVLIDPEGVGEVLHNLVHLVRNSLDHGLEEPQERAGKSRCGRITVSISESEAEWRIVYEDDGRGVDVEGLAKAAVKRGLMSPSLAEALTAQEKLELIFREGISTSERVSEVSGRGLGMTNLKRSVERSGGRIFVESRPGLGVRFEIEVPKSVPVRMAA